MYFCRCCVGRGVHCIILIYQKHKLRQKCSQIVLIMTCLLQNFCTKKYPGPLFLIPIPLYLSDSYPLSIFLIPTPLYLFLSCISFILLGSHSFSFFLFLFSLSLYLPPSLPLSLSLSIFLSIIFLLQVLVTCIYLFLQK